MLRCVLAQLVTVPHGQRRRSGIVGPRLQIDHQASVDIDAEGCGQGERGGDVSAALAMQDAYSGTPATAFDHYAARGSLRFIPNNDSESASGFAS
jgi:hypothetical protein